MATANQGLVLPPISASMRNAWKSCQRKVFYRYVAGIETKTVTSPARAIGQAFHLGIEHWRNHEGETSVAVGNALTLLMNTMRQQGFGEERVVLEAIRLEAYLLGYFMRWETDIGRLGKRKQELKLVSGHEVGFVDSLYIDIKGGAWITEDKTTSQFDDNTPTMLHMDEQLLNYALLLMEAGYQVKGAIYRQTLKTRKEPLKSKKETPADFRLRLINEYREPTENGGPNEHYREVIVNFDVENLNEYSAEKLDLDSEITSKLKRGRQLSDFQRNTYQCIGKFGPCDFLNLCAKRCDSDLNFKPNGKEALDAGQYQRKLWGDTQPSTTTAVTEDRDDSWADD